MTTPRYSRRETAHHTCAYMGQESPLLSCRLYHKLRRHESWQGLADRMASGISFLRNAECRYNAGIRSEATQVFCRQHEKGRHDEPA